MIEEKEILPYKKKAKKNTPPKAKHKHVFLPCVLEYEDVEFDKERGMVPVLRERIDGYCPMCGKIGDTDFRTWYTRRTSFGWLTHEMTPEGKRELNRETRTLPTFRAKDGFFSKFVELEEV